MRLLDLFCSAGGCTKGFQHAGFFVTGVDIKPQPRYCGNAFVQMDALEAMETLIAGGYITDATDHKWHMSDFAAISASPPCQAHTNLATIWRAKGEDYDKKHPDLIPQTRQLLRASGKPYVIENVPGAPLINPIQLTGPMFDLMTLRARLFELSFNVPFFLMPPPNAKTGKLGIKPKHGQYITVAGHFSDVEYAKRAMGIDWMTQSELAQAIPPAYTEWIGWHLIEHLQPAEQAAQ